MNRYIKRAKAWMFMEDGLVVLIHLYSGVYKVEIFSADNGERLADTFRRNLDDAKKWGRVTLPFWKGKVAV